MDALLFFNHVFFNEFSEEDYDKYRKTKLNIDEKEEIFDIDLQKTNEWA